MSDEIFTPFKPLLINTSSQTHHVHHDQLKINFPNTKSNNINDNMTNNYNQAMR